MNSFSQSQCSPDSEHPAGDMSAFDPSTSESLDETRSGIDPVTSSPGETPYEGSHDPKYDPDYIPDRNVTDDGPSDENTKHTANGVVASGLAGARLRPVHLITTKTNRGSANTTDDANDAAGKGNNTELAREVTGVWLLSTDYNYRERCNYLPVEFVQNLFKLDESVKLTKYSIADGCEVRLDNGDKVGFYFDKKSPFESTFQSEYAFDKQCQP